MLSQIDLSYLLCSIEFLNYTQLLDENQLLKKSFGLWVSQIHLTSCLIKKTLNGLVAG